MKISFVLILVFFSVKCFSQNDTTDFSIISRRVRTIKSKSLIDLSKKITESYTTELEKVKAIFSWITQNIKYDVIGASNPFSLYDDLKKSIKSPVDSIVQNFYNDQIVEKVIREKKAVCDGYARLFKALCDKSNIKSVVINGTARMYFTPVGTNVYNGHAWNAVSIQNKWYLLDVTWASGTSNGYRFNEEFNVFYFLTDPVKFFNDHFPDDSVWILLDNPPTLQQFYNAIYISQDFYKSNIISFKPSMGVIEPSIINDKLKIELETDGDIKNLYIVEYPKDTIMYDPNNDAKFRYELNKPHITKAEINGKKIYLYHYLSSCKARQILVYYDDKMVLGYGINRNN